MFWIIAPASRRHRRSFRPRSERLETRDCPSGGLLDPTFNATGVATTTLASWGSATAIQPDGKIVVVGNGPAAQGGLSTIEVVRLNPDGSLDTTFNGTGGVNLDVAVSSYGNGVAIQPDGKILICGTAFTKKANAFESEYVVARLNANGSLDNAFASHGLFAWNPRTGRESANKMVVLADGSILVGGSADSGGFTVFKLSSSGKLAASFGDGGEFRFSPNNAGGGTNALVLAPNGDVILAGGTNLNGSTVGCFVAVTPTGQLDTSFNGTGFATSLPAGYDTLNFSDMVLQNGVIVVSGQATSTGGSAGGFLGRYSLSGALDTTFGTAGTYFTNNVTSFNAIALEPDGSIIVGGNQSYVASDNTTHSMMAVAHLSAGGVIDTTFGTLGTGFSYVQVGPDSWVNDLALTSDGRIVVCGAGYPSGSSRRAAFAQFTAP
jgi:uncharacterized delta-60 repeat protein